MEKRMENLVMAEEILKERLGNGYAVASEKILKQGAAEHTIMNIAKITPGGQDKGMRIVVDDLLDEDAQEIVSYVENEFRTHQEEMASVPTKNISDPEFIRSHVIPQIVGSEKSEKFLETVPHLDFLDLSIIFRVLLTKMEDKATMSYVITNKLMKSMDLGTVDELFECAMQNIADTEYKVFSLSDFFDMDEGECPFYIATSKEKLFGANVMLREDIMDSYARKVGGDYYVLPSSVHELLFVEVDPDHATPENLREIVSTVNSQEVAAEEQISDNVYIWREKTKKLEIA